MFACVSVICKSLKQFHMNYHHSYLRVNSSDLCSLKFSHRKHGKHRNANVSLSLWKPCLLCFCQILFVSVCGICVRFFTTNLANPTNNSPVKSVFAFHRFSLQSAFSLLIGSFQAAYSHTIALLIKEPESSL